MSWSLSPSRASDFQRCPLLYRFRVVDRLPEPVTAPQARGSLVHAVLERLFDDPAAARTRDRAAELLEPQWSRMVQLRPELADLLPPETAGQQAWFDAAEALLDRWFTLEDPTRIEPAEREFYVETEIDGVTLRGYVDRLDRSDDGLLRIVDYKTGRAPDEMWALKAMFQLKFYALVLWRSGGEVPARLQLVYLGNGEVLTYDPDEADLRFIERKLGALWQAIVTAAQSGEFLPNRGRHCDFCAHRAICPAWGGTSPALPIGAAVRALDPRAELPGDVIEAAPAATDSGSAAAGG